MAACEGPVGPQGEQGVQGIQGERGERGEPGLPGVNGNSNIHVLTEIIDASQVVEDDDTPGLEVTGWTTPLVTSDVIDSGAVLAYFSDNGQFWFSLPMQFGDISMNYGFGLGEVGILILRPVGTPRVAARFHGNRIRFVVFAPPVAHLLDGVDTEDYEAVMRAVETAP